MPACVFTFNEECRFTWANASARAHVGYELAELLHLHPWDIKPEFSRDQFLRMLLPLRHGEVDAVELDTCHRHRAGHVIPVAVAVHLLPVHGGQYLAQAVPRDDSGALIRRAVIREANRPRAAQPLRPALRAMAGDIARDMDLLQQGRAHDVLRHMAHYVGWLLGA